MPSLHKSLAALGLPLNAIQMTFQWWADSGPFISDLCKALLLFDSGP